MCWMGSRVVSLDAAVVAVKSEAGTLLLFVVFLLQLLVEVLLTLAYY